MRQSRAMARAENNDIGYVKCCLDNGTGTGAIEMLLIILTT